jgi:hypothetical protein
MTKVFQRIVLFSSTCLAAWAGPHPGGPGGASTDAIPSDSALFKAWGGNVFSKTIGPIKIGFAAKPENGNDASPLGAADASETDEVFTPPVSDAAVISLGEGGTITIEMGQPIRNGAGADFAVFENGVAISPTSIITDLAFVEVSSNGTAFARFTANSRTTGAIEGYDNDMPGAIDPTNIRNLAGKHPGGYGTPFDLAEVAGASGVDVNNIRFVRIVDVIGSSSVKDPYPTSTGLSGFDLDAIGAINVVPNPFQTWQAIFFSAVSLLDPEISGPDADPDSDGRTNWMEFAVSSDPNTRNPEPMLTIARDGLLPSAKLMLHRSALSNTVRTLLQMSTDLEEWQTIAETSEESANAMTSAVPEAIVSEIPSTTTFDIAINVSYPLDTVRRYFRLAYPR